MSQLDDCPFCQIVADPQSRPNWIVDFPNSVAILHFNQVFHGRSILITRNHHEDMLEIPEAESRAINEELWRLADAIKRALRPDRLNYANYGNVVPHQHWHVFPRFVDDPMGEDPLNRFLRSRTCRRRSTKKLRPAFGRRWSSIPETVLIEGRKD